MAKKGTEAAQRAGPVRVVLQLEQPQVDALLEEAECRRKASGARRLNLSEVARSIFAAWMSKRR